VSKAKFTSLLADSYSYGNDKEASAF